MSFLSIPQLQKLRKDALDAHFSDNIDEAFKNYPLYLAQQPQDSTIWGNLATIFRNRSELNLALMAQERAMQVNPGDQTRKHNYANVLDDLGRYTDGIKVRKELLEIDHDRPNQFRLIGRAMTSLGMHRQACDYLEGALEEFPDDAQLELQLAFSCLNDQQYERGFSHYSSRWKTDLSNPADKLLPHWDDAPSRKRVVLVPEQGYGDTIFILRYLPLLKQEVDFVGLVLNKPVARLLNSIEGADWVGVSANKSDYDCCLPYFDLLKLYLKSKDDARPPLKININEDSKAHAEKIVAPFTPKLKVGVAWAGSSTSQMATKKSFDFNHLVALCDIPNVQLFSLYKGTDLDRFHDAGAHAFMVDAGSHDRDFADCAAVIDEMDLVITCDTAIGHLAGSLGKPTWLLLHQDAFWYWGKKSRKSVWYPQMKLFRQRKALDWDGVFVNVRLELTKLAKKGRKK